MAEGDPVPAAAPAVSWLKAKQFGMPRWVFLGLLAGAVGLGLYLRSRAAAAEAAEEELPTDEELVTEGLADQLAAQTDPSLEGVGVLAGPTAGEVLPVQAPVLPEGLTEVYDVLGSTIVALGDTLGRPPVIQQGQGQGGGRRRCRRPKPTRRPAKGHYWACVNGHWKQVKAPGGARGGRGGRASSSATPQQLDAPITGGGPPSASGTAAHLPSRIKRAQVVPSRQRRRRIRRRRRRPGGAQGIVRNLQR